MRSGMGACVLMFMVALFSMAACESTPQRESVELTTASSGDLWAALRGVSRVSLHPRARVVEPAIGRSPGRLARDMDDALIDLFRSRGYGIASPGQGQVEIAYAVGLSDRLHDEELFRIFGIAPGLDRGDGSSRGGIVVVLFDPRRSMVVWH